MLWDDYVFRRGIDVDRMWDEIFSSRKKQSKHTKILYIAGKGFDLRSQIVLRSFTDCVVNSGCPLESAEMVLVDYPGYQLSDELLQITAENAEALKQIFKRIGDSKEVVVRATSNDDEDVTATVALKQSAEQIISLISDHTDVVLDVSALPRILFLTLLLGLLSKLVPNKDAARPLAASGVNFHVLVGENAALDANIQSLEPSNDLVLIPGYARALQAEIFQDWPLVWFPILGENRLEQLKKVIAIIPQTAEVCPVVPHPSRSPRRGDELLVTYRQPLFDSLKTPLSNVLYAHEAHPFEAYRQIYEAMDRYRTSMAIIGGCRLVVTPLASKLITVGAALACFDMRPSSPEDTYQVAIPYAEPRKYEVTGTTLRSATTDISALLLTGEAYEQ